MADFVYLPNTGDSWHKQSSGGPVFATHLGRISRLAGRHFYQDSLEQGAQSTQAPVEFAS